MRRLNKKQMSPACGLISAGLAPNCNDPLVGGLEVDLILINKDDIASYTFNGTNALIIEAITRVATKVGYKYEGIKFSNSTKSTLVKGKYQSNFDHELNMVVFNVNGAAKAQLELLAKSLVVAVVRYKYRGTGGDAAFEILGREQGLELMTLERDSANADTQGAYSLQLKTPAEGKEGHLPAPFYKTDYATTLGLYSALTV